MQRLVHLPGIPVLMHRILQETAPLLQGFQRSEAFLEGPQGFFLVAALPSCPQTVWFTPEALLARYGASQEGALEGRPHLYRQDGRWVIGLPLIPQHHIEGWIFLEGQGSQPFPDDDTAQWLPGLTLELQAIFALIGRRSQIELEGLQQKSDLDALRTMLEIRQKLLATVTVDQAQQTLLEAVASYTRFDALLLTRYRGSSQPSEVVVLRNWPTSSAVGQPWDGADEATVHQLDVVSPAGDILGGLWIAQQAPNLQEQETLRGVVQTAGAVFALLEAQEAAHRAEQYNRVLLELSSDLELLTEPQAIARRALETLVPLTGFELGGFYQLQEGMGQAMVLVGQVPAQHTLLFDRIPIQFDGLLMRGVANSDQPLCIPDVSQMEGDFARYGQVGVRTLLVSRIALSGETRALIILASLHRTLEVLPEISRLFATMAHRLERALERAAHLEEINHTRESALKTLGKSLELRDLETRGHSDRVVGLSFRLGYRLGFPHLMELRYGAYMHDLGKLAIPDAILFKPGPLDATEYEVVRQHPETAYRMLSALNFLSEVALNVVRFHHEKWDGSGYPLGLKGEEIPLEARIFAAVDVFDALAYARPYKAAWTAAQVREELQKIRGRALDPQVVDALLTLIP